MSPFLDSVTVRGLYDVQEGGHPYAFRCMLPAKADSDNAICNTVTRTISGMITHHRIVHNMVAQGSIGFPDIKPTKEDE